MKNIDVYVEEKAKEFLKIAYAVTRTEPNLMEHRINIKYIEEEFIKPFVKDWNLKIDEKWLPTAENINALPESLRKYIYDLETNCDPPSLVRENVILKENLKALEMSKEKLFVQHIENHLKQMGIKGKVICKICEKDIDEIASEEEEK